MTLLESLRLGLVSMIALGLTACGVDPTTIECHRYEAGYLGRDNQFKASVPMDLIPTLDGTPDRLTLAFSLLAPASGQPTRATLTHTRDGKELSKWKLKLPPPNGLSSRCVIASTSENSNCGARLRDLPMQPGGRYILESDSERLIEAGLSFRVCEHGPLP